MSEKQLDKITIPSLVSRVTEDSYILYNTFISMQRAACCADNALWSNYFHAYNGSCVDTGADDGNSFCDNYYIQSYKTLHTDVSGASATR